MREESTAAQRSESEIQEWLLSYLAELLGLDVQQIEVNDSFASYGLDSSAAVGMVGDLEAWLDRSLDAELMYRHPTIETLSRYLASGADR